jgi:hypothetical protein
VAMLPPRLPIPPPTVPVSEICSERDSRGTAVVPAKADSCGSAIEPQPPGRVPRGRRGRVRGHQGEYGGGRHQRRQPAARKRVPVTVVGRGSHRGGLHPRGDASRPPAAYGPRSVTGTRMIGVSGCRI